LPAPVRHIHGDRAAIDEFRQAFRDWGVETAIDLSAYTKRERANPPAQAAAADYDAEDRALASVGSRQ